MGKKVGIVIPSYNQGKFLEEAIQSVIKNRKHIDIKLIVVDGGSTDGSAAIIKKYSAEIDWWRSREDEGQANAINIGMRQCGDCDYVMWLNSDDIYETDDAVARIVAFADTAGAPDSAMENHILSMKRVEKLVNILLCHMEKMFFTGLALLASPVY